MGDNVDIFIGTHKSFEPSVSGSTYKIIVGNHEIENNSNLELIKCGNADDEIDDRFFSEIYMLKWISEHVELKDYVGFCHYRKYFSFMDKIPDFDELFKKYDIIIGKPIMWKKRTIRNQYGACHNIEDFNIVETIIKLKYDDYAAAFNTVADGKMLIPYDMFVMKKEDFLEYIDFVWGVLNDFLKVVGRDIEGRINRNKAKYIKDFSPNDDEKYQYRIGGYLAERLTNVFIVKKFNNALSYNVKITEKVYDYEKRETQK